MSDAIISPFPSNLLASFLNFDFKYRCNIFEYIVCTPATLNGFSRFKKSVLKSKIWAKKNIISGSTLTLLSWSIDSIGHWQIFLVNSSCLSSKVILGAQGDLKSQSDQIMQLENSQPKKPNFSIFWRKKSTLVSLKPDLLAKRRHFQCKLGTFWHTFRAKIGYK